MTKVLMVTSRFIYGGIEQFLLNIFENTDNKDIQYELLTLTSERNEELIERVKKCGVNCYSLNLEGHNWFERKKYHYQTLYRFLKEHDYQVVHFNITSYRRSLDVLTAKLAGVNKRIIHSHSADVAKTVTRQAYKPLRKLYDYAATDFCACSDEAAIYLYSKSIIRKKKYKVINNGIRIQQFVYDPATREKIRKELGVEDRIVIGHVGRISPPKNHSFIIEVFREIVKVDDNYRLVLIGDGEDREKIKKMVQDLELEGKVLMLGAKSNISDYLSSFDIFLFPSKWEGLGISVIEAESNGLPCYLSDAVPVSAVLTTNAHRYNLGDGAKMWAERILKSKNYRVNETDQILNSGYSIENTIKQLESLYLT